jgi:hypothetical protein
VVAVPFGGECSVAQQALGEQLLLVAVVTSMSVSMRARFSWQIGLGRSSSSSSNSNSSVIGGELVSQIAQTDYALFRHAEATSSDLARALGVRV